MFLPGEAYANAPRDTLVFKMVYRCDVDTLEFSYLDNARVLADIDEYLGSSPKIDSVSIIAFASPEGPYKHNLDLSRNRATHFRDLIISHSPDNLTEDMFRLVTPGENWDGLTQAVEIGYWRNDREQVLRILHASGIGPDTRKWRLKQLDDGYTYDFLIRRFMPDLRNAAAVFFWENGRDFPVLARVEKLEEPGVEFFEQPGALSLQPLVTEPLRAKKVVAALKTNLLYDAVTAVNYSVEVPLRIARQNFSLVYDCYFPWWLSRDNRRCLEYLALGGEARWWFKSSNTLRGHYLGAYAYSGKADLQKDLQACYQFEFASAGLSYGYSMALCSWLNLEFSLSLGYAHVPYRHYVPTEDWQILIIDHSKEGALHYFGPTRACVTLALPISVKYRQKR